MSDYIIPEVITEILIRLPVKSLLRFRCVCKEWCSIISNPNFISKHLSKSPPSTLVRRYSKLHSKEFYTLDNGTRITFPFHQQSEFYFRIVGICNGLLCLSDDFFGYREVIIVWNPSIKRAITLPSPKVVFDKSGPYDFALGFGFDDKENDYKVVRVAYVTRDKKMTGRCDLLPPKVEVLSLNSGVWRNVKNGVGAYIPEQFWAQAVIKGAVHWVAYKKMTEVGEDGEMFRNLVLVFDLSNEKFVEMGLPEELACVPPIAIRATLVKGRLCILYSSDFVVTDIEQANCSIWAMTEYGNVESWTLIFSIGLETGLSRFLSLKSDGEILFAGESGELVSYNFEKETKTSIGMCGTKDSFFVDKFEESLVLLGKGRKAEKSEPDYEDEDERVEAAEYRRKVLSFASISSSIKPLPF